MNAIRNILILTSLIVGLAASRAAAEVQADAVFGPDVPTAEQQVDTDDDPKPVPSTESEESAKSVVDPMFLVKQISFEGVKTLSEDMLRTLIQTQVGAEVSPEFLTQDLKSLFKDTGFFADVQIETRPFEGGGLEIIYKVVESPKISGINFIGNDNLNTGKLKNEITLRPDEIFSDRRRWESERALRNVYHEKGYYLVGIQTHLDRSSSQEETAADTVQVTFEINEGPRVRIEEINFIGNTLVSAKALRK